MQDSHVDLRKRYYKASIFLDNANDDTKLSDIVILYSDGDKWKVIPLFIINQYPIIHDKYHEISNKSVNTITPISIYVCPYTLYSCIYFDTYTPNNKIYNNNIVCINDSDNTMIIPILSQVYQNGVITNTYIRKSEVKIMTLKNAISLFPDCLFMDTKIIPKVKPIVDNEYLSNNVIHYEVLPFNDRMTKKSVIYVIEYKSRKTTHYKYTILMPRKNTYDIVKNGFFEYFVKMVEKIRMKSGIIYTCLWFAWSGVCKLLGTKFIQL